MPRILLMVFVPLLLAAQTSPGPGSISGTVIGPDGTPVSPAWVQYARRAGGPGSPVTQGGSARIERDGSFSITGLNPGDYKLCVEASPLGFLNPCRWGHPETRVVLTPAQPSVTGLQLRPSPGSKIEVQVEDPLRLLEATEQRHGFDLLIGARRAGRPFLIPSRIGTKTATGRLYALTAPLDVPLKVQIYNRHLDLVNAQGQPLAGNVIEFPVRLSASQPTPPIVVRVVGAR
ncbi:MAG: hypothetical protein ACREMA_14765 [Longimicrobiales bacterium]